MASGQHITEWTTLGTTFSLIFDWTSTPNYANNSSTVTWYLYLKTNGSGVTAINDRSCDIRIGDIIYVRTVDINIDGKSTKLLDSGTSREIPHNADGTKSFSFYYKLKWDILGDSTDYRRGEGTGVLDSIPKPVSIITAPNFNDTENPTITFGTTTATIGGVVEACISLTGAKDDIAYRSVNGASGSYTFNLTDAERKILRQAVTTGNTAKVQFFIRNTLAGVQHWSHLIRTLSLVDFEPTVSPVVKDTNAKTKELTGNENVLIPGYSNAYFSIGASAKKEATVQSQSVTCGAIVETTATGTINAVPDAKFTFYCRDSRGNMVYHPYEAEYVPYFKVTCNQSVRLNLDGTADLTLTGKYFNGSFGVVNNTLSIQVRHREDGGEWESWEELSNILLQDISNNTYTLTAEMSGYDPSGTHEFQARAIDKLHTAYSGEDSIVLTPIFDWSRTDFNFNVPLTIEGNSLNDFVIETGTEAMGSNGTWYWRKWKSGRAECYGRRNYGDMAITTTWGGLYRSETFTQSLPSGLFEYTPEVIDITFSTADRGGWIVGHEESAPDSSTTGSFIVVRPASATLSQVYIGFNVIGRWK